MKDFIPRENIEDYIEKMMYFLDGGQHSFTEEQVDAMMGLLDRELADLVTTL